MEIMINPDIIKDLRLQKSWTQEQLAGAAGLSLRTIQRVEKDGVCSLETNQALAAVFNIDQNTLRVNSAEEAEEKTDAAHRQGRLYGMMGNTAGMICAYAAIGYSVFQGDLLGAQAGMWFGGIGFLCGLNYFIITLLSDYSRKNKIGSW